MELAPKFTAIDELENQITDMLAELFGEVGDYVRKDLNQVIESGKDRQKSEAEITDDIMALLRQRIADFDSIEVPKNESIDWNIYSYISDDQNAKRRKYVSYSVALGAILSFAQSQAMKVASGEMWDNVSVSLNKRTQMFRKGIRDFDRKADLFRYATANVVNAPPKVTVKDVINKSASPAPFKISVNPQVAKRFTAYNDRATDWLVDRQRYLKTVRGMTDTVRSNLNDTLAKGYVKGETAEQITNRVDSALAGYDKTPYYNARTIAKTEISGAANFGEYEFVEELVKKQAVKVDKQWIQRQRKSKRKTHAEVHMKRIRFEEKYVVDGEEMKRPHDENASAKNVVNCDCRLQFFYDDDGKGVVVEGDQHDDVARNVIKQYEQDTEDNPQSVGLAIEKIGDFVDNYDAISYIKDIAGVSVHGSWTLEELNAFSSAIDSMPSFEEMVKAMITDATMINAKIIRTGQGPDTLTAGYHDLETKRLVFSRPGIVELAKGTRQSYRNGVIRTAFHEWSHAIAYNHSSAFKKFAEFSWIHTNKKPKFVFDDENWNKKPGYIGRDYFFTKNCEKNPHEDWADTMAYLLNDGREMQKYLEKYLKGTILYRKAMFLKGYFNL